MLGRMGSTLITDFRPSATLWAVPLTAPPAGGQGFFTSERVKRFGTQDKSRVQISGPGFLLEIPLGMDSLPVDIDYNQPAWGIKPKGDWQEKGEITFLPPK